MELKELQRHWNAFGETDPLWAIITHPDKRHGKWDVGEFFALGRAEIRNIWDYLEKLGFPFPRAKALDFGCGAGRLTQALCEHFDECHGVDIAPSMVKLARQHNKFGDRCHYHLNERDDLAIFPDDTFSFIYSNIALQHMRPEYSRRYIKEFLRILEPGGLILFHLPSQFLRALDPDRTTLDDPLPESAFRAKVVPLDPPSEIGPGQSATVQVRVTNTSDVHWPAGGIDGRGYWLHLGNHWLDATGRYSSYDDGRSALPKDLAPGESLQVGVDVRAPSDVGRYELVFDMVQEDVAWFEDRGSPTVRVEVAVRDGFLPVMEVYAIERGEMVAFLEENGGRVVDIMDDPTQGENCVCHYYAVTKS
jgi:SAM-dependent methyltransferase